MNGYYVRKMLGGWTLFNWKGVVVEHYGSNQMAAEAECFRLNYHRNPPPAPPEWGVVHRRVNPK
jgi:hypothetical protein